MMASEDGNRSDVSEMITFLKEWRKATGSEKKKRLPCSEVSICFDATPTSPNDECPEHSTDTFFMHTETLNKLILVTALSRWEKCCNHEIECTVLSQCIWRFQPSPMNREVKIYSCAPDCAAYCIESARVLIDVRSFATHLCHRQTLYTTYYTNIV